MKLAVVGWNYKTTPIETREKLAVPSCERAATTHRLKQLAGLQELVILSTCNRLELYFTSKDPQKSISIILREFDQKLNGESAQGSVYHHHDLEAVTHLFKVTASLDSMVIGEPQITGQVKEAYQWHLERGELGKFFNGLFPRAFSAAKRIRNETCIAHYAVSISFAAVELARAIFSDLTNQSVMIIGAGEMAELAVKHLMKNGVKQLLVTNRTFANAVKLAESCQGSAIRFDQLITHLPNADIVIGSTGAWGYIITEAMVKQSLKKRKGRPMFFIDIALPRDIDPAVNELPDVFVYDIDDLQNVVDANKVEREKQAEYAHAILLEEVRKVDFWFKSLSAVPFVKALRERFQEVAQAELHKTLPRLSDLDEQQTAAIEYMMHCVLQKLLHTPTTKLRELTQHEDSQLYLNTMMELFELNESPTQESSSRIPHLRVVSGESGS